MMLTVRTTTAADMPVIWEFVRKKAAFDNWLDKLEATEATLSDAFFGPVPMAGVLLAEDDGEPIGFATYFYTFSTYLGRRGIWLDDLYVNESRRGRGAGKALLRRLAQVAEESGCPRLEWVTAATNDRALGFYQSLGATVQHSIRVCRMEAQPIQALARA